MRNHAKMVDCYLTTFNNHMSMFGDKKAVARSIVDHPEKYRDVSLQYHKEPVFSMMFQLEWTE